MTAISAHGRIVRPLAARPGQKTRLWVEITDTLGRTDRNIRPRMEIASGPRAVLAGTRPWMRIDDLASRTIPNARPWMEIATGRPLARGLGS